jgi:hypothetical protein
MPLYPSNQFIPNVVVPATPPPDIDTPLPISGPYYYLPTDWDAAWKAAKSAVGSQRISVVGIGDSDTAGEGASDIVTTAWWPRLRSALLSANGNRLGGDHFGVLYTPAVNLPKSSTPLTMGGTINTDWTAYYNSFNNVIFNNNAQTPLWTCAPAYNVVGFDILYQDFQAGSWTYNVDGGSNTTVTVTNNGTYATAQVKKISITGLTSGLHTLHINSSSTTNSCTILGITAYASTSGICFANNGWQGLGLVNGDVYNNALLDTSLTPVDRLAMYQGYTGIPSAPTALSGLGFPAQPDLAIVALGINDAIASVSRADFRNGLERLIWSLRYGKNDACSIIIVAMYCPDGTLTNSSTTVANMDYTNAAYVAYRDIKAAMLECAQANNCAFVDVHSAFGRQPIANGWVTSASNLHPTDAGHLKIATLLGALV